VDIFGKNIIVTGGANGIGRVLVEKLLAEKAVVGVLDIDAEQLKKLKDDYPQVYTYPCNITETAEVEKVISCFTRDNQTIDILVNVAGIVRDSPLISISGTIKRHDVDLWNKVLAVNLTSAFIVTSHVVEHMIKTRTKGLVINVSSVSAGGNAGQSAYSAAKAGIIALTKTWAKELNGLGIRVACIAPGFTRTGALQAAMNEKLIIEWIKKIPVKRLASPSEIAEGMIFIIRNDYFNGKTLELDGGLVL